MILVFGFLSFFTFWQIKMYRIRKKHKASNQKRWIMEELIYQCGTGTAFPVLLQFLVHSIRTDYQGVEYIGFQLFFSILFVLTVILFYIMIVIIPSKAQEYLKQTYPEYTISN